MRGVALYSSYIAIGLLFAEVVTSNVWAVVRPISTRGWGPAEVTLSKRVVQISPFEVPQSLYIKALRGRLLGPEASLRHAQEWAGRQDRDFDLRVQPLRAYFPKYEAYFQEIVWDLNPKIGTRLERLMRRLNAMPILGDGVVYLGKSFSGLSASTSNMQLSDRIRMHPKMATDPKTREIFIYHERGHLQRFRDLNAGFKGAMVQFRLVPSAVSSVGAAIKNGLRMAVQEPWSAYAYASLVDDELYQWARTLKYFKTKFLMGESTSKQRRDVYRAAKNFSDLLDVWAFRSHKGTERLERISESVKTASGSVQEVMKREGIRMAPGSGISGNVMFVEIPIEVKSYGTIFMTFAVPKPSNAEFAAESTNLYDRDFLEWALQAGKVALERDTQLAASMHKALGNLPPWFLMKKDHLLGPNKDIIQDVYKISRADRRMRSREQWLVPPELKEVSDPSSDVEVAR